MTVDELVDILDGLPGNAKVTIGHRETSRRATTDIARVSFTGKRDEAFDGYVVVGLTEDGLHVRNYADPNEVVLS